MKTKLTPSFVNDAIAASGAERTIFWDTTMAGFGLMVTTKGAKSYVVQYRAGRRSRRMTIDGVLDLSKARKRAKALLGVRPSPTSCPASPVGSSTIFAAPPGLSCRELALMPTLQNDAWDTLSVACVGSMTGILSWRRSARPLTS
jgi:hypothetical protein